VSFSRRPLWWQALHQTGLFVTLACAMVLASGGATAREAVRNGSPGGSVALSQLPPEAQNMYQLIQSGGPFPGRKDGVVFGNRERMLPRAPRGFYHEYTVNTPGARNRGARRIVCGGRDMARPEACYYTGDHYASFQQIVQ